MKKLIFIWIFIPALVFSQYNYENTTEQSFEELDIYFSSHYLNTFGIKNFKNIAVGFIDNPFLNLQLNPGLMPDLGEGKKNFFYLDFRGDRTEAKVVSLYHTRFDHSVSYYRPFPFPDPRYISQTREEPEPIFSLGFITMPNKKIYLSASYQALHRKEKFYSTPYYIYYPYYATDSFGARYEGAGDIPVVDIYSAKDEMILRGHFFTAGTGYQLNEKLSIGAGVNVVLHERDGDYIHNNNDEYGDTDNREWHSLNSIGRNQDYDHWDANAGAAAKLTENFSAGLKIGYLKGKVDQDYNLTNSYFSQSDEPYVSSEWNLYLSDHNTSQRWRHDGATKYFRINFAQLLKENSSFSGYYGYSKSDIDLTNSSSIYDTSAYSHRYYNSYEESFITYESSSLVSDVRSGEGLREKISHEILIKADWQLTEKTGVSIGFYSSIQNVAVNSVEDAAVVRESFYGNSYWGGYNNDRTLDEIKTINWNYESKYWTFQIPVFLHFNLSEKAKMIIGINRILEDWNIENQTLAYFDKRERLEEGELKKETNFIERYTKAPQNFTEDRFDLIFRFEALVSDKFKINLILDPDSEIIPRLAQWWLSFHANI